MKKNIFILACLIPLSLFALNPIIPNKGANDPHIRIIDGKAYLSASHDKSPDNNSFIMEDWWLWSSTDLINWELEYQLKPEETYIGKPFQGCWATDIVKRNGKYYWYFSERNHQTGVMVADTPKGPWTDPLGIPLLNEDLTPTHEYDIGIIQDSEGEFYIVFGVWNYYIARLNADMISLAETPRKIEINDPRGPYNSDGKNIEQPTDDKPFLHMHQGKYYLSWGCFYGISDNVYGPYAYKGCILEEESFANGYAAPTWPHGFKQGRHGSFFEWNNQCYFAYCDISQTSNRYFRDTFISYIHYKPNGEIGLIQVDGIGVGEYNGDHTIQAENYSIGNKVQKVNSGDNFSWLTTFDEEGDLTFNNIHNLNSKTRIELVANGIKNNYIEIRKDNNTGKLLGTCQLENNTHWYEVSLPQLNETENICFVFKGNKNKLIKLDSFIFK